MPTVSVIISTYTKKRLADVLRCISSLENQTVSPIQIILVLDPCDELVEFYKKSVPKSVMIVRCSKKGLSHARNVGIKNAIGEIVAFIDDDAYADKRWIESLVANYQDPKIMGVGGLVKPRWNSVRPFWFPPELDWIVGCSYKGSKENKSKIRNPIGCNMSFRKSVFEKIGYFSTDFGRFGKVLVGSEEMEISLRLYKKISDGHIIYEPSSIVYHNVPKDRGSLKYMWKRSFFEGVSKALVNSRYNGLSDLSLEDYYLRYLLGTAIPSRVRLKNMFVNFFQAFSLFLSMFAVFAGYLVTNLGD